jgi:hypothetical protein
MTSSQVKSAIVDNEGSIVRHKGKLYRISGLEIRGNLMEYKLVSVNRMFAGFDEPLWVLPHTVEFLRN